MTRGRIILCLVAVVALAAPWTARAEIVRDNTGHRLGVTPQHGVSLPGGVASKSATSTTSQSSTGMLVWNNGPVLHSSAPYLIYWTPPGESIPAATKSLLQRYFTDVAADSATSANVYGVARQYTDATGFADYRQSFSSAQVLVDADSYPAINSANCPYTSSSYPHCITDGQLQSELQHELSTAHLPSDGSNGNQFPAAAPVYFVVLPTDVNVCYTSAGQVSCANNTFCAYHDYLQSGSYVLYATIPTIALASGQNPKSCQYDGNSAIQQPNGTTADIVAKYVSHEDNEAITDPLLNAWFDPATGNENGDDCNAYGSANPKNATNPNAFLPVLGGSASGGSLYNQIIGGNRYYLQSEWSNGDAGCRMQPSSATVAAAFAAPSTTTPPGSAVTFDPSASTSSSGYSSATWNFGDNSPQAFNRGSQAMSHVAHTYAADGTYTVSLTLVDPHGNVSTTTRQVIVDEPPNAAFQVTTPTPGSGQPTGFDGTASSDPDGAIDTYTWNFGDGTSSTGATATHTYQAPGTYNVTLTVHDTGGQTATALRTVTVAGPTPQFSSTPALEGAAMTVNGSASSDSQSGVAITSYTWNFGDGTTQTGPAATTTHVYAQAGPYWITLTVTDATGFTSSISQQIVVADESPSASFQVTANPGSGLQTAFDGTASFDPDGSITSYSWDFGDGTPAGSGSTPAHVYANPGTYTVALTVTDTDGQTVTTSQSLIVAGPAAGFTGPSSALESTALTFDGSQSTAGPGTTLTYSWSADDGWTATGSTATHAFTQPGAHTVTLTVANDLNQTATASHTVNVIDELPTAAFAVTSTGLLSTVQPVTFNAAASTDPDGAITGYAWQWGDGTAGSGGAPSHMYRAAGTYTVTLVITDSAGEQSTPVSQRVTVHAPPAPAFSVSPGRPPQGFSSAPGQALEGTPVLFDASGSSEPEAGVGLTSWAWSFGDGSTARGATTTHAFSEPGTYTITLAVTNTLGLSTTVQQNLTVADELPVAAIVLPGGHPATGVALHFAGTGTKDPDGFITSYSWSFGDRTPTVTGQAPTHVYHRAGTFTITLTVVDSDGRRVSVQRPITVAQSGHVTKVKAQNGAAGPTLLITVSTAGWLRVWGHTLPMSSAGMGRAKVRLSHAQLRTLTAHGSLRVRVPLTFAPVIGPNATRWLTLLFRPARHPGRAYTVTLLRR